MNQRKNTGQTEALRAARKEQRRIAMFNLPHAYKLASLAPRQGIANDDSPAVAVDDLAED